MINIGLIGFGYWAQNYFRLLLEVNSANLLWVGDINKKSISQLAKKKNDIKLTSNYSQILADENVNAVIIATPTSTHAKIALDALKAGKHVLVEKPLAANFDDAAQVVNLSKKRKKVLMVGQTFISHPAVTFLKNYIKKGNLGEIFYLYSTRTNLGPIRTDVNVIYDLASHDLSTFLYLLNKKPKSVFAQGASLKRKNFADVAFITLKFEGNVVGNCHVSWLDPVKIRRLTIVGAEKMAVFDDIDPIEKVKIYNKGASFYPPGKSFGEWIVSLRTGDVWIPKIDLDEPLKLQLLHFLDCLGKGLQPKSSGEHGATVVKILDAVNKSLTCGKEVKV